MVGISRGSRLGEGVWDERVALDAWVEAVRDWVADQNEDVSAVVAYSPAVAPHSWSLLGHLAAAGYITGVTLDVSGGR